MVTKYALIVENNKELNDYIKILNRLCLKRTIYVKIISLADIYKDKIQIEILKKIQFAHEILEIKNPYNVSFTKLNFIKKVSIVINNKHKIFKFASDCNIILSGIQTIFERLLYSDIKSKHLNIKTIVYHRHLLFNDKVNTEPSKWKSSFITKAILKLIKLDGLFIDHKAIGYADFYIVLGQINADYLERNGVNVSNIYILGSLEYDNLKNIRNNIKDQTGKTSICYVTSACEWIDDTEGEIYQKRKLIEYLDYFKDKKYYSIWIRVHPRENVGKYSQLISRYPFLKIQQFTQNSILDDLNQFDILIGGISTALFEASLLKNKKVIFFILKDELYRYEELIDNNGLKFIDQLNDISLERTYSNLNEEDFIMYNEKETAEERILKFMEHRT